MEPVAGDNDLGFWESRAIAEANEKAMESLGIAWTDPDPVPQSWFRSPVAERYEYWLVDLLRDEYGDAPLFVVKDPRICRLVPLWQRTLTRAGATARFVIPVRNPLEVAASLKMRNDLSTDQSLLLWLRHVLEVERDTRGSGRAFLSYEDLLRDWRSSVDRLSERLGVAWPRRGHETDARIESFLSPKRRHQRFDTDELEGRADVVSWVKEAYRAAVLESAGHDESNTFDSIRQELDAADLAFGGVLARSRLELRERSTRLSEAVDELTDLRGELSSMSERIAAREAELGELRSALHERGQKTAELREALTSAHSELAELRLEADRLLAEEQEVRESQGAEMHERLRGQLARLEAVERTLTEVEAERDQFARRASDLREALDERQAFVARAEAKQEAQRRELLRVEAALDRTTEELAVSREEIESGRRRFAEDEAALQAELGEKDAALGATARSLERARSRVLELETALARTAKEVAIAREDMDAVTERLARRDWQWEQDSQAESARAELDAAEIDRLRDELQFATADAEKAQARADQRLGPLQTGLVRANSEIEVLRNELGTVRRAKHELEDGLEQLQSQLHASHDGVHERERLLDERSAELADATAVLADATTLNGTLQSALETSRREHAEMQLAEVRRFRQLAPWIFKPTPQNLRLLKTYRALKRSEEFDRCFYYMSYQDVARARMNPLRHFVAHGWKERRNPNRTFDTGSYLERRPDVAAAGLNPLFHYIRYGRNEEAAAASEEQALPDIAHAPREIAQTVSKVSLLAADTSSVREGTTAVVYGEELDGDDSIPFPAVANANERPFGDTAAVAHLEALRSQGLSYLLVRGASADWLSGRVGFRRYLSTHYPKVPAPDPSDALHDLRPHDGRARSWRAELDEALLEHQTRFAGEAIILDWHSGLSLAGLPPQLNVATPPPGGNALPYLPDSFDVVLALSKAFDTTEARRVARNAVITMDVAGGPLRVDWLRGPELRRPTVSIVIPTYNGSAFLRSCLRALHETLPRAYEIEVIVCDDASDDDTPIVLSDWAARDDRFRSIRNEVNSGFLVTCNNGVHAADGEIIVFLNNDTVPISGWLPPLVRTLLDRPRAGAVGGKMLFPDGTLQEAGSLVYLDATGANFGKYDFDPDAPVYNFVREVDYCSAALLATTRTVFLGCGGFDLRFSPAYYEDTDFCFQVRQAGLDVLYQPESSIVHAEGGTSGTDISTGVKRHQEVNREKFLAKWGHLLCDHPSAPAFYDRSTWEKLAVRPSAREG
jgi:GT2 family glycosyltransferase